MSAMMPRCKGKLAKAQDSFFRSMIVYEVSRDLNQLTQNNIKSIPFQTPRLVKVHNVWLGFIIRFCQIAVVGYVLTYAIYLEKGYQVGGRSTTGLRDRVGTWLRE